MSSFMTVSLIYRVCQKGKNCTAIDMKKTLGEILLQVNKEEKAVSLTSINTSGKQRRKKLYHSLV